MSRFGFVGGAYQLRNVNANCQRCQNWFAEIDGSSSGASLATLEPTWGLDMFAALTGTEVRGAYFFNGRLFVVTDRFYEVFADGTFTGYSFLPDDGPWNILTIAYVAPGSPNFPQAHVEILPGGNQPIPPGSTVTLSGLTTHPELNGTASVIQNSAGAIVLNPPPALNNQPYFNSVPETGTVTTSGPVGQPVTMAANNSGELLICAAGELWLFPLVTPISAPISTVQGVHNPHGPSPLAITCGTTTIDQTVPIAIVQGTPGPNTLSVTCGTAVAGASANISTVQGIHNPHGASPIAVTCNSMPFQVGQVVGFAGLTSAVWLNGYNAIISSISGNTFYATAGSWLNSPSIPVFPFGPTADTGTASLPSVINGTMPFSVGQTITFSGLTNAAWLNGLNAIVTSISGNTFSSTEGTWTSQMSGTGGIRQFPYGPAADTGTATAETITTTMPFSVGQTVYFEGLTTETWLNGYGGVINAIIGDTLYTQSGSWLNSPNIPAFPFGPITDTGTVATAVTQQITNGIIGPVASIDFIDGYFIALLENSQQVQWSALEEGLTWVDSTGAPFTFKVNYYPDNVVAQKVNARNIWYFGPKQTVVYWDCGDLYNPFIPIDGAFFEYGLAAEWSVSKLDNGLFWVGQDERGWAIGFRSVGWTPQRISTHAIEEEWNSYPTVSDAIAYSIQAEGHQFWHVYFPTANKSWRYDVATGLWHEPCFWDGSDNVAHRSRVHVFAFGKHLLGDTTTGSLYLTDPSLLTDNVIGAYHNPIRRVRRAPHITNELEWEWHHRLRVHLQTGLGPMPPLMAPGINLGNPPIYREPEVMLRWSDDGGNTWSNEYVVGAGMAGEFKRRVEWRRLGRSRDRVYEVDVSDAIPWRLVDAYLFSTPSNQQPMQRYATQLAKMA